jgi:hypothetical protein
LADNVLVASSGSTQIATDDVNGIQYQRIKVTYGPDGAATDVSSSTPLPVSITGVSTAAKQPALGTAGTASADVLSVQGVASMTPLDINADTLPLPTGAATEAKQDSMISALTAPVDALPPPALSTTKRLTRTVQSSSTATTTSLVGATASQTTRLHRAIISTAGATLFEFVDGSGTNLRTIRFAGAGIMTLDFSEEPWCVTPTNSALQMKTGAAVQVDCDIEYVKSA